MADVLVLNKCYTPIAVTDIYDAISKVYNNIAEVVTVEDGSYCNHDFSSWVEVSSFKKEFEELRSPEDEFISSPSLTIVVPRIIRILTYDKLPPNSVKLTRRNLFLRDNYTCQYCGKKQKSENLSIDHIIPRASGGKTTWDNVVCSCIKCNRKKGGKSLKEANMKLLKVPEKPKYNPTLILHLFKPKYKSWESFISEKYWTVELEE